jgi:RloB-like protein
MQSRRRHPGRRIGTREIRQRFLIVCEGAQTEPTYFEAFQVPGVVVRIEPGAGNTIHVVERAIELRNQPDADFDQIWCVFDRDEFPAERFNRALALARQAAIRVAYSNEAFELWFLLHFGYYHTGLSRSVYIVRLSQYLGLPYRKNDRTLFGRLEAHLPEAIRNAERLLQTYQPSNPAMDNPSTTVHQLVQELIRHGRK